MATRKPANRLTLTISDDLKHALARLNSAAGVAAATFVGEIVEAQTQMILELADAVEKSKSDPILANEMFQRVMLQSVHQGTSASLEIMEAGDKLRTYNRKDDRS